MTEREMESHKEEARVEKRQTTKENTGVRRRRRQDDGK